MLGGGKAFVETPSGVHVVGTTLSTPNALVRIAGIEQTLEIPQEYALEILANPEHHRHDELRSFVHNGCGGLEEFEDKLQDFFNEMPNSSGVLSNRSLPIVVDVIEQERQQR